MLNTVYTCRKSYTKFASAFWGLCCYLLHDRTNSRSFNGLLLISEFCHQALYIFRTIIVAVDLPFQVNSDSAVAVERLVDFLTLERIFALLIGSSQAISRFFYLFVVFLVKLMKYW
jgi:hypothetical protein